MTAIVRRPPKIIAITSEEQWKTLRAGCVTATTIPAVLGVSQWMTKWQFYRQLKGQRPEVEETEGMKWGKRLEPVIAQGICDDHGWMGSEARIWATHALEPRFGCTPDWEIWDTKREGPGILELKNVSVWQHRAKWEGSEAPVEIELQLQAQLEICDYDWGVIGALVGGMRPLVFVRERDREVGRYLLTEAQRFLVDVDRNIEPTPDYARDITELKELYGDVKLGTKKDMSSNNRLVDLCAAYKAATAMEKEASARKDAAVGEILTIVGNVAKVDAGPYQIASSIVAETHVSYTRRSYRNTRVTERKS